MVTVTWGPSAEPQAMSAAASTVRNAECGMRSGTVQRRAGCPISRIEPSPSIPHSELRIPHSLTSPTLAAHPGIAAAPAPPRARRRRPSADRKSTRLNSSHGYISYAVFCLKKKKKTANQQHQHRNTHKHYDSTNAYL